MWYILSQPLFFNLKNKIAEQMSTSGAAQIPRPPSLELQLPSSLHDNSSNSNSSDRVGRVGESSTPEVIGSNVDCSHGEHHEGVSHDSVRFPPNLPLNTPSDESLSQIRLGTPAPRRSKILDENLSESPMQSSALMAQHHSNNPNHVHFTPDTVMK